MTNLYLRIDLNVTHDQLMTSSMLYEQLAHKYRLAISSGTLRPGDRMPSVRDLAKQGGVSLSTAMAAMHHLESEGLLQARPRAGFFVSAISSPRLAPIEDPHMSRAPDPAQFVGIHTRVSQYIAAVQSNPVKVNLSVARCAPELYPVEALKKVALASLRTSPKQLVTNPPAKGLLEFRSVLAKRALGQGMTLLAKDILVTNGCIEALNLALRATTNPGDTVMVESPLFYGLLQILETLNLKALEIPTSPTTGISLDAVDLALQTDKSIKAVVVVPHLQNPLGSIMPNAHKERLLALCQAHQIALIEDDTYSALMDDEREAHDAPLAIKSWDKTGAVIHCASLHKVLAPGMRLGWMSAGRWQARVEMLKYSQSRNNDALQQYVAAQFIGSPAYDRHLRQLRAKLKIQRQLCVQAINLYFPDGTRVAEPDAGLAIWVRLPDGVSSQRVFEKSIKEQIFVAPGHMFSNSMRFDNYLRLNCGWPFTQEIDRAIATLGTIVRSLAV